MDAIRGAGMSQTLVVVSRWFGGTKLGTGGLIRAYGSSAEEVLRQVPKSIIIPMMEMTVNCPYDMIGWVERTIKGFGGEIKTGQFLEQASLTVRLPAHCEALFRNAVKEDGAGRIELAEALN